MLFKMIEKRSSLYYKRLDWQKAVLFMILCVNLLRQ